MKLSTQGLGFAVGFIAALLIAGCEKEPPRTEAPPPVKRAASTHDAPAERPAASPQPKVHDDPPAADALNPANAKGPAGADPHGSPAADAKSPTTMNPNEPPTTNFQEPGKQAPPPQQKPAHPQGQSANPPLGSAGGAPAKLEGNQLTHGGISMTVPAGWQKAEAASPAPMGPKAIFTIPGEAGTTATVRITHFPEMKGSEMNDMNIDRWLGQVTKVDGSPTSREEAKIETKEKDGIKLTIVDAKGTVKATMRDTAQPDGRLIAAIVDHPEGPHFVVAAGPAAVMDKAAADVVAFIESAKTAK